MLSCRLALLVALFVSGCGWQPLLGTGARTAAARFPTGTAERGTIEGEDWVRLQVPGGAWDALMEAGLDLGEDIDLEAGAVSARLRPSDAQLLDRLGIRKTRAPWATARVRSGSGLPEGYASVQQIHQRVRLLAERHSASCQVRLIGRSVEGRPLEAWRLASPAREVRPVVMLLAGVHARELAPVEVALALGEHLASGYGREPAITRLLDLREVWIVPMVNPDGRLRVEAGDAYWRKNVRALPGGQVGVDLNRNHDVHWSLGNPRPEDEDYRGTEAVSEPEARAVRDLIRQVRPKIVVDVHAFAGMVLWPPGVDKTFSPEEGHFSRLARPVASRLAYRAGTLARTLYRVTGDVGSWALADRGVLGLTVELDDRGFQPPYSQVMKDWEDWRWPLRWWFEVAVDPLEAPLQLPPEPRALRLPTFFVPAHP
ncbi:MAG: M14 family zinc carboxypeptidase [Candidatus Sericytochromatia bacterium]|nr:M14 family zinc carboxypeptidase [Candidatus Sericytochromatia bacterium]